MKKRTITRLLSLAMALCLCLGLFACGGNDNTGNTGNGGNAGTGETSGAKRDVLNYGLNAEPGRLDPQMDALQMTGFVNRQVYDTLLRRDDATGEIKPSLATEWEWVDDTTLHLTIRDDVVFHNGDPMTVDDVVFTLQRCATGNATAGLCSSFDAENIKALDDTHVELKLLEPCAPTLNVLCTTKTAVVSKAYCESVDETTFGREPVGTGPFKLVEWVSGDHLTLERNDEYWDTPSSYKTLNFRVLTDATARAIELETGGVDIIDTLNGSDLDRFAESDTIKLYTQDSTKLLYLLYNQENPILANEKVRQAIAHAIDMQAVVDMAFGSNASLAKGAMSSTVFGFTPLELLSYDVELSKQLLAEAGYADGFSFRMVMANMASNVRTAEAVQGFLAEVGITVEIETYDAATWMTMLQEGDADSSLGGLTTDTFDPDQTYSNMYADSGNVSYRTDDETVNRLLNEGKRELDETKRKEIYAELQEYIIEHAIIIPVAQPLISYATQSYVDVFVPNVAVQPDLRLVQFSD